MRRGLVGDDVDRDAAAQQLGQHGRAVARQPDRQRLPGGLRRQAQPQRVAEPVGHDVQVPGLDPPREPCRVHVDDQAHAVVQRDGQRLRAAHPAAPAGHGQRPGEGTAEPPRRHRRERLVGALQDALGADVDPGPGGHLPVHGQPGCLKPAELRPVRPVADQVRVGDEHAGRPLVGADHPDGLARLDQHGLVTAQLGQRPHHGVERGPRPRGPPGAAVDDEVIGPLGDLGVEVVHQHAQGGLGLPGPGGEGSAARGADGSGTFHACRFPTRRPPLTAGGLPIRAPAPGKPLAAAGAAANAGGEARRSRSTEVGMAPGKVTD